MAKRHEGIVASYLLKRRQRLSVAQFRHGGVLYREGAGSQAAVKRLGISIDKLVTLIGRERFTIRANQSQTTLWKFCFCPGQRHERIQPQLTFRRYLCLCEIFASIRATQYPPRHSNPCFPRSDARWLYLLGKATSMLSQSLTYVRLT